MRSLLGRFHRPFARGVMNNTLLTNNLGDGSTLSLDFTTGILDPRLTFTRTSNATFINSSGYVEWANSNMYWNTAFEGLSGSNPSLTSSGWGYALSTGGAAVFNGDGSVTVTTTAAERRAIFRSSGFSGGGLRVVASVDVTIHSGSLQASQVIVTGTPSNAQHYVNGVIWNISHPNWNGGVLPVGTQFNISYATDSQTSGTTSMYFGVGCSSTIAGSATFSNPRWTMWKGSGTVPYYPNTSVTNNVPVNTFKSGDYQAPRFDYDPTTLQPRGLLIEGSAINLVKYSQDLSQVSGITQWYAANFNTPTVPASPPTDPFGGTSASWKLVATAGAAYHVWRFAATFTADTYTFSFWARAAEYNRVVLSDPGTGRGGCAFVLTGNGTAIVIAGGVTPTNPTIVPYANGWYRCSVTMTMTAATYGIGIAGYPVATTPDAFGASYNADGTSGVYATGMQVELGSGASSYIPTGASQGSRTEDSMTLSDIGALQFNQTTGTFVVRGMQSKEGVSYARTMQLWGTAEPMGMAINGTTIFGTARRDLATMISEATRANTLLQPFAFGFSIDTENAATCMRVSLNGSGTSATRSATGPMAAASVLRFNQGSAATAYASMNIRSVKFWPTVRTVAELNALTTGA